MELIRAYFIFISMTYFLSIFCLFIEYNEIISSFLDHVSVSETQLSIDINPHQLAANHSCKKTQNRGYRQDPGKCHG